MLTDAEIDTFERDTHLFLYHFLALPNGGGSKLDATLYVHWLVHHAATSLRVHGPCAWYSCETLERHNSFARFFVRHHSNFQNVARECFLYELMFIETSAFERKPRAQKKRKAPEPEAAD